LNASSFARDGFVNPESFPNKLERRRANLVIRRWW
jgi:hypothetical protein